MNDEKEPEVDPLQLLRAVPHIGPADAEEARDATPGTRHRLDEYELPERPPAQDHDSKR